MKISLDLDTSLHRLKVLNNLGTLLRGHPVATTYCTASGSIALPHLTMTLNKD
jgi:hypothetical protein